MRTPDLAQAACKVGFVLNAAASPLARIPASSHNEDVVRSSWIAGQYFLQCASALEDLEIRPERLDPWRSGDYCTPASEYNAISEELLKGFLLRLSRFQLIWSAYENVRNNSRIGNYLKSNGSIPLSLDGGIHVDDFPFLETFLSRFDASWRCEDHPYKTEEMACLFDKADIRKMSGAGKFCRAGLTLNKYRNFIYHADESLPEPGDSFDHFDGSPLRAAPQKWVRLEAASILALLMIYMLSLDWLPRFLSRTNCDDENLYLVDLSYEETEPHLIAHELARQIFR